MALTKVNEREEWCYGNYSKVIPNHKAAFLQWIRRFMHISVDLLAHTSTVYPINHVSNAILSFKVHTSENIHFTKVL